MFFYSVHEMCRAETELEQPGTTVKFCNFEKDLSFSQKNCSISFLGNFFMSRDEKGDLEEWRLYHKEQNLLSANVPPVCESVTTFVSSHSSNMSTMLMYGISYYSTIYFIENSVSNFYNSYKC